MAGKNFSFLDFLKQESLLKFNSYIIFARKNRTIQHQETINV